MSKAPKSKNGAGEVLIMATSIGKLVKVVKRVEREQIKVIDSTSDSRTPAQLRREIVAVVISWISDKERSKAGSPRLSVRG